MLHQNIGEILSSRYKIVQNLGYGLFGQNYLAEDLKTPLHTECIIKCLESAKPSHLDTTRLRFATEVEILQRLETHKGIPKIIAAFEENNQFYLVQELISGHSLTDELPINENWGNLWNESKVVKFLQEVLGILETVHFYGIVHCDLKPDNLIRRAEDGKLFITDFGSLGLSQFEINSFASIPIENTALGYTPPEQFSRQMHLSMDIYALGMIAIQGMTRLSPMQLQQDQETNNVIWHFNKMEVSEQIAAILSKMVCYDFRKRY
jgi:serine/threonine protein kinase